MEVILLERIKSLGQMGDRVHVKAGYARNFLLPFKKALRANKENLEKFEKEKVNLEAKNLETKTEAEKIAKELKSKKIVLIRSAAESGALYGSVTARDIELAVSESGIIINRRQIELNTTIKESGLVSAPINLHPEISVNIEVNVARSAEEATAQDNTVSLQDDPSESDQSAFFEKESDAPDYETVNEADDSNDKEEVTI